jgi:hypothetical protein
MTHESMPGFVRGRNFDETKGNVVSAESTRAEGVGRGALNSTARQVKREQERTVNAGGRHPAKALQKKQKYCILNAS